MSFDLYFYKQKSSRLKEEDIAKYLSGNLFFNNSEYDKQWFYENPDTGTYFIIEWQEKNIEEEDIELFDSFTGFVNLNFYFYINFFRPTFFGLEIFPLIDKLIQDLDLYVLNPQDEESPDMPQKFKNGMLLDSWIRSNDKVARGPHENFTLEYLPLEKSNYFWRYQFHKNELENKIKEDIYVPNLYVLKNYEDDLLYTAFAWTTHIPTILPKVDYIIIQKKYRKLFRSIEESGVVSYKSVINKLGKYFTDFEFEVPDLKILRQYEADKMKNDFNSLVIYKTLNDFGTGVAKDSFVNILQ